MLTITSVLVTENDLAALPETVQVYSAEIDGKNLPDKWVVSEAVVDATARAEFTAHLIEQGYIFD